MNQRRVHPPAEPAARRISPHTPGSTAAPSPAPQQVTVVQTSTLPPTALRHVGPRTHRSVPVDVATPPRRVAAPVALPTTPLALSVLEPGADLATGRGLTYEWEFFLADVRDRVADLEAGGADGGVAGPAAYRHVQTVPGSVWNVRHDLGYDPAGVLVVSDDGYVLDGVGVQYLVSGQTLRLSTDIAVAGVAYFS